MIDIYRPFFLQLLTINGYIISLYFFFRKNMSENPWHVESIQDFAFLNCPECAFKTKEEGYFQVIFFQQISTQRFSVTSVVEFCGDELTGAWF